MTEMVAENLPLIDEYLARGGMEVQLRPLMAALEFVRLCVVEVRAGDGECLSTEMPGLMEERWFGILFREVDAWYRNRYGAALKRPIQETATGFVVLWHTPFRIDVPVSPLTEPGESITTLKLSFPETVLETEDPLDWLSAPPILSQLTSQERGDLEESVRCIASLLRSIHSGLSGVNRKGRESDNLLMIVRAHVQQAGERIVATATPDISPACWDLQMACECAMKVVIDRRTGAFPKTHALNKLHALAAPFAPEIERGWVDCLPDEKTMIALRYREAPQPSLEEYSAYYRAALQIVDKAVQSVVTFRFPKFAVARRPWLLKNDQS